MTKDNLVKLIERYKPLGIEYVPTTGATLIGRAPHIAPEAWLNTLYDPITISDIDKMENSMGRVIPVQYRNFLLNCSNGLNIVLTTLCLFGCRKMIGRSTTASRQPFDLVSLNKYKSERPQNATPELFFFGGYDWDGSQLYLTGNGEVHFCSPDDCTSLKQWASLDDFLSSEIPRIYSLFDEKGVIINESTPTIPI